MKRWKQIIDEVGYDPDSSPPDRSFFYGYSNGQVVYKGRARSEAEKVSIVIERTDNPEWLAWVQKQNELFVFAQKVWKDELRKEYSDVPDALYQLCFEWAEQAESGNGFDAQAAELYTQISRAGAILRSVGAL